MISKMTLSPWAVDSDSSSGISARQQLMDHSRRVVKALDGFEVFGPQWTKPWVGYAFSPLLNRLKNGQRARFSRFNARWGQGDLYTFANLFEDYPLNLIIEGLKEVEVVIDLGANVGAFSCLTLELLRQNGLRLPIVAVEPNAENHRFLCQQPFASSVEIRHAAVGPENGTAHLVRGINSVSDHVDFSGTAGGEMIQVLSLESLCDRPALVKMDIEGGEWPILERGLPDTVRHLLLEWHPNPAGDCALKPRDLVPGNWQKVSQDLYGSTTWYFRR